MEKINKIDRNNNDEPEPLTFDTFFANIKESDLDNQLGLEKRTTITKNDVNRLVKLFEKFNCTTVWSKVKADDFTVRRFEFGFACDTCCCELTPNAVKRLMVEEKKKSDDGYYTDDDCTAIVVKYRNKNFGIISNELEDSWIDVNTFLVGAAQKQLTPRLVYIDNQCSVQEFVPSRSYNYDDDCDPASVRQLARILARIHCLQLPLSNNSTSIWKFYEMYENAFLNNTYEANHLKSLEQDTPERKEKYYETLSQMELKEPLLFAMNLVRKVNSPVMMTHGDVNRTNRLVREIRNNNDDVVVKKEIFMVDMDNGGYAYRGIDLGSFFADYKIKNELFGTGQFVSDEEMKIFLNEYRTECIQQWGDRFKRDPRNSLEHLILESKVFALLLNCLEILFFLSIYKSNSEKADTFLSVAIGAHKNFHLLRKKFTDDGTIECILQQQQQQQEG